MLGRSLVPTRRSREGKALRPMVLGKAIRLTRVPLKTGMADLAFVRTLNDNLAALVPNPDREGSPGEGNRVFMSLPGHSSLPADRSGSGKSHPIGRNGGTGGQSFLPEPVSRGKNVPEPDSPRTKRYLIPNPPGPVLPARSQNAPSCLPGPKESETAGQKPSPCRSSPDILAPVASGTGPAHCRSPPEPASPPTLSRDPALPPVSTSVHTASRALPA